MKMDIVAGSGNDEHYTPPYAVRPILEFVERGSRVWCPFDTAESHFVTMLRNHGCVVTHTHLCDGEDYLTCQPPECDLVVSNPPYSKKNDVLLRAFSLGIPFAFLVGVVGLFESKTRFNIFANNPFEILYLSKRVAYFKDFGEQTPSLHPPFSSVYLTHKILPCQIMFREVERNVTRPRFLD